MAASARPSMERGHDGHGFLPGMSESPSSVGMQRRNIAELPISGFVGPDVTLPFSHRVETLDGQLADVVEKLQDSKTVIRRREDAVGSIPAAPMVIQQGLMKGQSPSCVQQMLEVYTSPMYKELVAYVEAVDAGASADTAAKWGQGVHGEIRRLLTQLSMTTESKSAERQLREAYQWFQAHREVPKKRWEGPMRPPSADVAAAPPPLPDFWTEETAADAQMPGSAFYEAPPREDEAEADAEVAAAEDPGPPERSGRPPVPTLPPAKERLRNFETRQIISPLALRKLKAAAAPSGEKCESPEPGERPMTPSTATGGHSARSGGYSARSTPLPWTPGTSRPGSAMSYNLPQRPLTPGSSYGSRPGWA